MRGIKFVEIEKNLFTILLRLGENLRCLVLIYFIIQYSASYHYYAPTLLYSLLWAHHYISMSLNFLLYHCLCVFFLPLVMPTTLMVQG